MRKPHLMERPLIEYSRLDHLCNLINIPHEAGIEVERFFQPVETDSEKKTVVRFILYAMLDDSPFISHRWEDVPHPVFFESEQHSLFRMAVIFAALDRGRFLREQRKYPVEKVKPLLAEARNNIMKHREKTGEWGGDDLNWVVCRVSHYMTRQGNLYIIPCSLTGIRFTMFRNSWTRQTTALCAPDMDVREDGQFAMSPEERSFLTRFNETDTAVIGTPIAPSGYIMNKSVQLDKKLWQRVLGKENIAYELYIPQGIPYEPSHFLLSFKHAIDFYGKYFPEMKFTAFFCLSWLFSPQIEKLIQNPESRIIEIFRQGFIIPERSDMSVFYKFIFGYSDVNIKTVKITTSLQKNLVTYLREGNQLNWGRFVYLLEDIDRWGSSPYQSQVRV
ncbi:MAG: hypothetical protein LBR47_04455 [Spirochaetaceae bacterium]|nr:hypothetical protein [Spirochaetaceae bacterium]